jgi:Protein tyrosine and serine/threonine kinase
MASVIDDDEAGKQDELGQMSREHVENVDTLGSLNVQKEQESPSAKLNKLSHVETNDDEKEEEDKEQCENVEENVYVDLTSSEIVEMQYDGYVEHGDIVEQQQRKKEETEEKEEQVKVEKEEEKEEKVKVEKEQKLDAKKSTAMPAKSIAGILEWAMKERKKVWISYAGGSAPLLPRPIVPKQWSNGKGRTELRAVCVTSGKVKSFKTNKIVAPPTLERVRLYDDDDGGSGSDQTTGSTMASTATAATTTTSSATLTSLKPATTSYFYMSGDMDEAAQVAERMLADSEFVTFGVGKDVVQPHVLEVFARALASGSTNVKSLTLCDQQQFLDPLMCEAVVRVQTLKWIALPSYSYLNANAIGVLCYWLRAVPSIKGIKLRNARMSKTSERDLERAMAQNGVKLTVRAFVFSFGSENRFPIDYAKSSAAKRSQSSPTVLSPNRRDEDSAALVVDAMRAASMPPQQEEQRQQEEQQPPRRYERRRRQPRFVYEEPDDLYENSDDEDYEFAGKTASAPNVATRAARQPKNRRPRVPPDADAHMQQPGTADAALAIHHNYIQAKQRRVQQHADDDSLSASAPPNQPYGVDAVLLRCVHDGTRLRLRIADANFDYDGSLNVQCSAPSKSVGDFFYVRSVRLSGCQRFYRARGVPIKVGISHSGGAKQDGGQDGEQESESRNDDDGSNEDDEDEEQDLDDDGSGQDDLANDDEGVVDIGNVRSRTPAASSSSSSAAAAAAANNNGSDWDRSVREIPYGELFVEKKPIGSGAYGVVYRGIWRGAPVAIKKLQLDGLFKGDEKKFVDEFRAEVSVMTKIGDHPNVIRLLGVCTDLKNLALITPWVKYGSLEDLCIGGKAKLALKTAVRICRDIAAGILHLHCENIIHRDLALRNVLVGENYHVYVNDFGLSRLKNADATYARTQSTLGPVKNMAPEAILEKKYSEKSDTFSYGILLWQLFTRQQPYPDLDPLQLVVFVSSHRAMPPLPPIDNLHPSIAELMSQCMHHEPSKRPDFQFIFNNLHFLYSRLPQSAYIVQ